MGIQISRPAAAATPPGVGSVGTVSSRAPQKDVFVVSTGARQRTVVGEVLSALIATGGLMFATKLAMSYMDPYKEQRQSAKRRSAELAKRLGRKLQLNEFEQLLASNVLNPAHIDVTLDQIGGMDDLKEEMRLKVLQPLLQPQFYCTTLCRPTKGVLFYGEPGTGKTMLAKALAQEGHCFFLNITASAIMSKWLGDANRFIRAIFTLARKLQPCIIFIDEVDAFLTKRGGLSEHEATLQAKTEFMQLWDGMEGARGEQVLVMGATNRREMVDEACLRRFTLQYPVGLPGLLERKAILLTYLRRHDAEMRLFAEQGLLRITPAETHGGEEAAGVNGKFGGVDPALLVRAPRRQGRAAALVANGNVGASSSSGSSSNGRGGSGAAAAGPAREESPLDVLARETQGRSGSDLMELCSQAAQQVLTERLARPRRESSSGVEVGAGAAAAAAAAAADVPVVRQLGLADLQAALRKLPPPMRRANAQVPVQAVERTLAGLGQHQPDGSAGGWARGASLETFVRLMQVAQWFAGARSGSGGGGSGHGVPLAAQGEAMDAAAVTAALLTLAGGRAGAGGPAAAASSSEQSLDLTRLLAQMLQANRQHQNGREASSPPSGKQKQQGQNGGEPSGH